MTAPFGVSDSFKRDSYEICMTQDPTRFYPTFCKHGSASFDSIEENGDFSVAERDEESVLTCAFGSGRDIGRLDPLMR